MDNKEGEPSFMAGSDIISIAPFKLLSIKAPLSLLPPRPLLHQTICDDSFPVYYLSHLLQLFSFSASTDNDGVIALHSLKWGIKPEYGDVVSLAS